MRKIIIYLFNEMTDYEITFLTHLLTTSGNIEIIPVSENNDDVVSRSGLIYKISKEINDLNINEIDGLILTGGWKDISNENLIKLIQELDKNNKLLAAICGAGTVALAKAKILDNVKYTTPINKWTSKHKEIFGLEDPFPRENYLSSRVIVDKNVITAQGVAFIDFTVEVCDYLKLFENEKEKQEFYYNIRGK